MVLESLSPAERLAFVLHDMFAMPFDEIAPIVGRSEPATRKLASRARNRVRGQAPVPDPDLARQREVVDAFLAASREGDFDALVAVLAPDVVLRADSGGPGGGPTDSTAREAVSAQARRFSARSRYTRPALVNGAAGAVDRHRRPRLAVMGVTVVDGLIAEIDIVTDPERLAGGRELALAAAARERAHQRPQLGTPRAGRRPCRPPPPRPGRPRHAAAASSPRQASAQPRSGAVRRRPGGGLGRRRRPGAPGPARARADGPDRGPSCGVRAGSARRRTEGTGRSAGTRPPPGTGTARA